jgi:dihydroxy-acid dehydratase
VRLRLPAARPGNGVALAREWVADSLEIQCLARDLDGLLLHADRPEDYFGMLVAALRLDLPTVCARPDSLPLLATVAGLGLVSGVNGPATTAVALVERDGPSCGELVDNFSLANALRAAVAAGGGPELLVHLAALAREAGVAGFDQMIRVLAPETSEVPTEWLGDHGVPALLSALGDALHDVPTVTGNLAENLPPAPPPPEAHGRLVFVRARASGAEAVCRVRQGLAEVAGECRVFGSEKDAVTAVHYGGIGEGTMLVVGGCGPRGGPGLPRLDGLGLALRETGLEVPVLTDGLAPEDATGTWISLFTPEATMGGVIGLLRHGDPLRVDLTGGRIRAEIRASELENREPARFPDRADTAYAARYVRSALPALEGAGFD